ncbi:MAG: bifunctional phosphoglucose/phosphomannose isomerase [Candidatus Odinarchaeota archaeon]
MLDNTNRIRKIDPTKQIKMLEEWPQLIQEAYNRGKSVIFEYEEKISCLVIAGMGGSAISGDFLVSWLEKKTTIPIILNRKYSLPAFDNSLALCISYSGNTEETISALNQSLKRSRVVLISSDGAFEEIATAKNLCLVKLPTGYQPRYAFPLIFFALVGFLEGNGFIPIIESEVNKTVDDLKQFISDWIETVPEGRNPAKQMARKLKDTVPLILSSHPCLGHRIKGQINENAKMICYYDSFPEMFHNTIVSWESSKINDFKILRIKLGSDLPKLHSKLESVLAGSKYLDELLEIEFDRNSLLSELILTVAFTDFVTTYLAILNGKDPSIVPQIEILKKKFAGEQAKELENLRKNHL